MASSHPAGLEPAMIDPTMIPSVAPPQGMTPNFSHPVTLADSIIAVGTTTAFLAFIFLVMRLYSTLKITRSASYDDSASVFAFVFMLVYLGVLINARSIARHSWDLPVSAFTAAYFKIIFFKVIASAFALWFSKIAILLLLFRLFSSNQRFRHLIYLGITWNTVITLTTIIVTAALCVPKPGESFSSIVVARRCSHDNTWSVVQGVLFMLLDFYILGLPLPIVRKLQMSQKRKTGVIAIFMTGLIACVASTASLAYRAKLVISTDGSWNSAIVQILVIVELNASIMVACMPACASFSRYLFNRSDIISSIKSRFTSSRPSNTGISRQKLSASKSFTTDTSDMHRAEPSHAKKYWRIKNPFVHGSTRDCPPPQITMEQQHSRILRTVDFGVFEHSSDPLASADNRTKRASMELKPSPLNEGDWAPYDLV